VTAAPEHASDGVGETAAAGDGLSDDQFAERVAGQTSSDLQAEDVFEREADGASTDAPVSAIEGEDLT
jgi:deglycase